jgi:hypothetical protein
MRFIIEIFVSFIAEWLRNNDALLTITMPGASYLGLKVDSRANAEGVKDKPWGHFGKIGHATNGWKHTKKKKYRNNSGRFHTSRII